MAGELARAGGSQVQVQVLWSDTPGAGIAEQLVLEGLQRCPVTGVRLVRLCPSCGSDRHGRPVLTAWPAVTLPHVSLSRAGPVTVVALCDAGPVGVDVEPAYAAAFDQIAQAALHPWERTRPGDDVTVTWVRKESLVKATGQGLAADLTRIRITAPPRPPDLVEWTAADPPVLPVRLFDVQTAAGHVAAVTVLAAARPRLVVTRGVGAAQAL